jgi:hypothetical protein
MVHSPQLEMGDGAIVTPNPVNWIVSEGSVGGKSHTPVTGRRESVSSPDRERARARGYKPSSSILLPHREREVCSLSLGRGQGEGIQALIPYSSSSPGEGGLFPLPGERVRVRGCVGTNQCYAVLIP